MAKPVTVLYLGSLTHSEDSNFLDKTRPHEDEIDFQNAVKIALIRIPRPGKDIYSKHISVTQTQPIKNLEIYYRNLEKTSGRFSLLLSSPEVVVTQNDDILITPKQGGNFTKLTVCIYGNVIRQEYFLLQKCPNFRANASIQPMSQSLAQMYGKMSAYSKKDVFEQKREVVRQIQSESLGSDSVQEWQEVVNDDGINEQQIENICNLSQKLLTTYNNQHFTQELFVVEFRTGLEDISTNLAKIFKNKHLGLYYPSFQDSNIAKDLSISITKLALYSLDLSLSEQVRGLEILKFALQLDRHTEFFIEHYGVEKLIRIFVDFFKVNSVVLSTYKNLCLEVLISVSHWKKAALKMTETLKNAYYHEIFEDKPPQTQKLPQERERSREKKVSKRSRSESASSHSDENKKKKKDKQKKRNKSKEKKKSKESKEEIPQKPQEAKQEPLKVLTLREQIPNISFYEILMFYLEKEKSCKQLILVKILLEQILQTLKKNKIVSERVALSTSLLKDLKYIFNPAGEVLNTKSLKQFASCYHPYLNSVQSEGVDAEIVAEREKLRHMRQYGIDPKLCKILNRISEDIASSQCEQNDDDTRTPFNSFFIVMMSELIRSREPSVLYGFGRLLNSFRQGASRDIIHLKRVEAAMTMISEYVYKILLEDDGLFTVLNIDQIYAILINISNSLSKDQSAFTKELKRKIRQLTNYAMAYDLFTSSEGNFKTISEYFLRLFKFEHYQINKISDFKKKEFERVTNPFSFNNVSKVYGLGSFHQLFPEQPLLEIDVYLKIFNIILQYNKNAWSNFYENKLVCGFSVLFTRLSSLITFLIEPSVQRQCGLGNIKKLSQTVENYLNVMSRLLKILVKRAEYEAAFNDLIDEDIFENVELYERSFSLYVTLFNAINNNSSLLSGPCKKLAESILAKILTLFDKLLESYELTSHQSRESKVKELWIFIYKSHFVDLKSRGACLSLFAFLIETLESGNMKVFNSMCLEENSKTQTHSGFQTKGHVPKNEKSLIQNLINANIYRSDPIIRANLTLVIKNLIDKNSEKIQTTEKVSKYLEAIFDEIDSKLKEKGNNFENAKDLILLEKLMLFTDVVRRINCTLTVKIQQKLLKQLKQLESIRSEYGEDKILQKAYKFSLKIKTNIVIFLRKGYSEKTQNPQFLTLIQILAKYLDFSPKLASSIKQNSLQVLSQAETQIENESLKLLNSSLEFICACSSNPFNQSIILYEVFLEKPYKPSPQLSLISLFNQLTSTEFLKFMTSPQNSMALENSEEQKNSQNSLEIIQRHLKDITIRSVYFLCLLTSIDSKDFYSTESRRNAIISLITQDKDFPFYKLESLKNIVPIDFIQTLKDYFAYPIVEKPLTLKMEEKKESLKNKGYLFSKALFSIIMEGEPTAKTRYFFIGGPWKSGDMATNFLYTPTKERNYAKNIEKFLAKNQFSSRLQLPSTIIKSVSTKTSKSEPQMIEFTISKFFVVEKKPAVESQIKLVNIPLILENLAPKIEPVAVRRISPSPSNKGGYNKPQIYDNRVRVSPSPPSNKAPGQNIIGFNPVNQPPPQYGNQPHSSSVYGPNNTAPMNQTQTQNVPMAGMTSQPQMSISINSPYDHSVSKNINYESPSSVSNSGMDRPVYPNPYYSTNSAQKPLGMDSQPASSSSNLPYMEMQKGNSQNSADQMRGSSNSAPRSNVSPYNRDMGYQQPPQNQPYYNNGGGNQPYMNSGPKMGNFDNRTYSPHQNKGYSQNYGNQRHNNGNYYNGHDRNMGSGFNGDRYGDQMMGNNPRHSGYNSHSMGNRPHNNHHNNGFNNNYRNQPQNYPPSGMGGNFNQGMGNNYPPSNNFQQPAFNSQVQEEQRQYNDAILLVTELRGFLPQHLKTDKKNRLKQILVNPRIQVRVKEYINTLK